MTEKEKSKSLFGTVNFERRRHPRCSINLPVEYWKVDQSISGISRTGDISEGGLLLYISEQVEVGQELHLKLSLRSDLGFNAIESRVRVVWTDFSFDKESGRVGLKFIEISGEDLKKLKIFLSDPMHFKINPPLNSSSELLVKTWLAMFRKKID